jgi:hypothetical protein
MHKLVSAIGAAALVGTVALSAATPASAAPWWHRHHHYHRAYPVYPVYPAYPSYYYYRGYDPGAAVAAGIIGGVFGTIAGAAIRGGSSHVARCEAHFRSYDRASDTYLGYDGVRHRCRL